ncbi:MAG: hypothetical protein ACJ79O_23725 [Myxococcales bacterium]
MKLNRRMADYLGELRSRNIDAASVVPGRWPDLSVQQIGDVVLLDSFCKKPSLRPSDFYAASALECCANKVLVERMLDPWLVYACPLLLLTGGLFIAEQVSKRLVGLPGRFNVIVSYDGESCAVRFHKIREGESWLCNDLESYVDEGILVVEAGAAPVLRLTGN